MKAIIRSKRGKEFSTMEVKTISSEAPGTNEVRVKMISSRINPVDMDLMKGFPSLKYKNPQIGGIDGSGEIIELGSAVKNFEIGDEVFFYRLFSDIGTWGEEIVVPVSAIAKIPTSISAKQAGGIALPLLTAYESIISLESKKGETILIHGAGGGVGFQAVQIAKRLGLKVISNASDRDEEVLIRAGVDQLINYRKQDFSKVLEANPPDYVFDVIGKDTLFKSIQLKPKKVVSIAFPDVSKMHKSGVQLPGLLKFIMKMMGRKFVRFSKKSGVQLIGQVTGANGTLMASAAELISQGEFLTREPRYITLQEIELKGLEKKCVGSVILF